MSTSSTVTVVQSADQCHEMPDEEVIVINELLEGVSKERVDNYFYTLSQLELDPIAGLQLFRLIWPRFATVSMYDRGVTTLTSVIIVYEEIKNIVERRSPNTLQCQGVDRYYLSVIDDLARNENVRLETDRRSVRLPRLRSLILGMAAYFYVLAESVTFAFVGIFSTDSHDAAFVFVPHLNRFQTMEPVIKAAGDGCQVVVPITELGWRRALSEGRWTDAQDYDPVPITRFATPKSVLKAAITFGQLFVAVIVRGTLKRRLGRAVYQELGVDLDRMIDHAIGNTYGIHISSVPNIFLAASMIEATGCEGVAVGAQSLRQQSILHAAETAGIRSFHIPHTIPLHQECIPRTDTVHFVPGPISEKYLTEAEYISNSDRVEAAGRPLLERLRDDRPPANDDGILQVVIATQPFPDDVRRAFVNDVIDELPDESSVVVKIHPNEERSFYTEMIQNPGPDVTVAAADLETHLKRADITFVINTNVGIESVALGTPCVSVNYCEPRLFVRPYAASGPIPVLRTPSDLSTFLSDLDKKKMIQLREKQIDYIDKRYHPQREVAAYIADRMQP